MHQALSGIRRGDWPELALTKMVQAPRPGASPNQIKEEEAEHNRYFAAIIDRPKGPRRMSHEIGHRHLTAKYECDWPGEKAQQDQCAASNFDDAGVP